MTYIVVRDSLQTCMPFQIYFKMMLEVMETLTLHLSFAFLPCACCLSKDWLQVAADEPTKQAGT